MVDLQTVCCMCGDVGFPDKLFRCNKCRHRFQHSYCSNYYMSEYADPIELCDWCQSEGANKGFRSSHAGSSKRSAAAAAAAAVGSEVSAASSRSEYSGEKIIKLQQHVAAVDPSAAADQKGKSPSGAPSPRTTTRRYKLLKDVMC